jgi:chromosome segregation ATPase
MSEFEKLRKRLSLIKIDDQYDSKFIKEVKNIKSLIDSQEKYYNSIMSSIRTSNTLANIIDRILKKIIYLENYGKNKCEAITSMYVNERNLKEDAENDNVITIAYLEKSNSVLNTSKTEIVAKSEQITSLTKALEDKEVELSSKNKLLKDLQTGLEAQINQTTECNNSKNKLKDEIIYLNKELNGYKLEIVEKNKEIKILTESLETTENEIKLRNASIENLTNSLTNQATEYSDLKAELENKISKLNGELTSYESESTRLKTQLETKTKELEGLTLKIEEIESRLSVESKGLQDCNIEFNKQKNEFNDKLAEYQKESKGMEDKLELEKTVLKSSIDTLKNELEAKDKKLIEIESKLQSEIDSLENYKIEYKKMKDKFDSEINTLSTEKDQLNKSFIKYDLEYKALSDKKDELTIELEKYKTESKEIESKEMESKVNELDNILKIKDAELTDIKSELSIKIDNLEKCNENYKKMDEGYETNSAKSIISIQTLNNELTSTTDELKGITSVVASTNVDLEKCNEVCKEMEESFKKKIEELELVKKELETKLQSSYSESDIKELQMQVKELEMTKSDLVNKLQSPNLELENATKQLKDIESHLAIANGKLEKCNEKSEEMDEKFKREIAQLNIEKEELMSKLAKCTETSEQMKTTFENTIKKLENQNNELNDEKDKLNKGINSIESELKIKGDTLEKCIAESEKIKLNIDELNLKENELMQLKNQNSNLDKELSDIKSQFASERENLRKCEETKLDMEKQVTGLTLAKTNLKSKVERLLTIKKDTDKQMNDNIIEMNEIISELNNLKAQLNNKTEEITQRDNELQKIKQSSKSSRNFIEENIKAVGPTNDKINKITDKYITSYDEISNESSSTRDNSLINLRTRVTTSINGWDTHITNGNKNNINPILIDRSRELLSQINNNLLPKEVIGRGSNKSDLSDDLCIIQ